MKRVFVSYSQDSPEHTAAVAQMCDRLRGEDGFEVVYDGYATPPEGGWFEWSHREIEQADAVVMVCTPTYRRRFEGKEQDGIGLGASWEASKLRRQLIAERGYSGRIVCVLMNGGVVEHIPELLWEHHRIQYARQGGHQALVEALLGAPRRVPPQRKGWSVQLAGLALEIVGAGEFASWAFYNFGAPEVDPGEGSLDYVKRVIVEVEQKGKLGRMFERLAEQDPRAKERLGRIEAQWRSSPNTDAGARPRPGRPTPSVSERRSHEPVGANSGNLNPVTEQMLLDELATVLWDPDQARLAARNAGVPPGQLPAFRTPVVFWSQVVELARHGAVHGGVKAIAREAAKQYPGNGTFGRYERPL